MQLPPEALAGLSVAERAAVANFHVPSDGVSTLAPILFGSVQGDVLEFDQTTTAPFASVSYRSGHPLFGRTWTIQANDAAHFSFDSHFGAAGGGGSTAIPQAPYTLTARHPATSLNSPAADGAFNPGTAVSVRNVVFSNAGIVTGVVKRHTGALVTSGSVRLFGSVVSTNVTIGADGRYEIGGVSPGSYTLTAFASHPQGTSIAGTANVSAIVGQKVVRDITLQATGSLTGTVRTATGALASGVSVQLQINVSTYSTQTDAAGVYRFSDVATGSYTLTAYEPSTGVSTSTQVVVVADQTSTQNLVLIGLGTVQVQVRFANGAAAPSAQIYLYAANDTFSRFGSTDPSGQATFTPVPVGDFRIIVYHPLTTNFSIYEERTGSLHTNGESVSILVNLPGLGTVSGRVTFIDGSPAGGSSVYVLESGTGNYYGNATTNANGDYAIPLIPAGRSLILRAYKPPSNNHYRDVAFTLAGDGATATINAVLPGVATLRVTALKADGTPLANAFIYLRTVFNGFFQFQGTADASGVLSIPSVPEGPFAVVAGLPSSGVFAGSASGEIVAANNEAIVDVTIRPTIGTITGAVRAADASTPIPSLLVTLIDSTGYQIGTVSTDASGVYRFQNVTVGTGTFTVRVTLPSDSTVKAEGQGRIDTAGQTVTINLTLAVSILKGQVRFTDGSPTPSPTITATQPTPSGGTRGFMGTSTATGTYVVVGLAAGVPATVTAKHLPSGLIGTATATIANAGVPVTHDIELNGDTIALPTTRYDANDFVFDLQPDASIGLGYSSVFAGDFASNGRGLLLDIVAAGTTTRFAGASTASVEESGQEISSTQNDINGLEVTRKVFVPRTGYFARYLERLSNPTTQPITVDVRILSNLRPYLGSPRIISTSSGDAVVDVAGSTPDRWVVIDDGADDDPFLSGGVPAVAFAFDGPGGQTRVGSATFSAPSYGALTYGWNSVTVPAGGTVSLMHFVVQQWSDGAAQASAQRLVQLPPEALAGLSAQELASLQNFAPPSGGVSTLSAFDIGGTVNGHALDSDLTPLQNLQIRLQGTNVIYGRLRNVTTDTQGAFTFASRIGVLGIGNSLPIPIAPFNLFATHPVTSQAAPPTTGSFGAGQTIATQDIWFSDSGSIRGTVTDASTGLPLAGVSVWLYTSTFSFVAQVTTNAQGAYSFPGVTSGNYYVRTANSTSYVDEVYNDVPCPAGCSIASGASIPVVAGQAVQNINFALSAGVRVSGRVTVAATGAGIQGIGVQIYNGAGTIAVASGSTDANGNYITSPALMAGSYYARTTSSSIYVDELFNNIACGGSCPITTGQQIALTVGGTTTVNFALDVGGSITGTLTNASTGAGISGAIVFVYGPGSVFWRSAIANGSGGYTVPGLATGNYFVLFQATGFTSEIYNDIVCGTSCNVTSGTAVPVTLGATTPNINASLSTGGQITGRITDEVTGAAIPNSGAFLYTSTGNSTSTNADSQGVYTFSALAPGDYYVRTYNSSTYVNEVYNNLACVNCFPSSVTGVTKLTIVQGQVLSGIDFGLRKGARVVGRVTSESTGQAVASTSVQVYNSSGSFVASAVTNASGDYITTEGLPTGTYYVRTFAPSNSGLVDEVYNNKPCPQCTVTTGTGIPLTPGNDTTIDFALAIGGRISGTITNAATGAAVTNAFAALYQPDWHLRAQRAVCGGGYRRLHLGCGATGHVCRADLKFGGFARESVRQQAMLHGGEPGCRYTGRCAGGSNDAQHQLPVEYRRANYGPADVGSDRTAGRYRYGRSLHISRRAHRVDDHRRDRDLHLPEPLHGVVSRPDSRGR